MIPRERPPARYPLLGMGSTRGRRYARVWRISMAPISPAPPSAPCSTPSFRRHLNRFLREVTDRGDGGDLPRVVEQECCQFLACGLVAHGFARVRAARGTFASAWGRFPARGGGSVRVARAGRMTERDARLVDEVVPPVPVRQGVFTLPYRLRDLLAWDHGLSRAVLAVHARAPLDLCRQQAERQGIPAGHTRAVTAVQRFGGGLGPERAPSHAGPRCSSGPRRGG
jgi:hypothetical protein